MYMEIIKFGTYGIQRGTQVRTPTSNIDELFEYLQKEYGKCIGNLFVVTESNSEKLKVGWGFKKICPHGDLYYGTKMETEETWVLLFDKRDHVIITKHYYNLETKKSGLRINTEHLISIHDGKQICMNIGSNKFYYENE